MLIEYSFHEKMIPLWDLASQAKAPTCYICTANIHIIVIIKPSHVSLVRARWKIDEKIGWGEVHLTHFWDKRLLLERVEDGLNWISGHPANLPLTSHMRWGQCSTYLYLSRLNWMMHKYQLQRNYIGVNSVCI